MEVDTARQSTLREKDHRYSPGRDIFTKGYTIAPTMSTVATMNPVSHFSNSNPPAPSGPPPPYRATVMAQAPPQPTSGPISPPASHPTDSRRTSDDIKEHPRLPSLAEAIGTQPTTESRPAFSAYSTAPSTTASYAPSYTANTTPTSQRFAPEPAPYTSHYDPLSSRRASPPQPIHPTSTSYPRNDRPQSFSDPLRQPPPPPLRTALPTQSPSHPSPYARELPPRREPDARYYGERSDPPNGYGPPPNDQYRGYPSAPPPAASYHPNDRPYHRPMERPDEYGPQKRVAASYTAPYESTLKRNLDVWEVESNLDAVLQSSSKLSQMSSDAFTHVQRYGRGGPSMEGNPSIQQCDAMIQEADRARSHLNMIRTALIEQDQYLAEQHHRRESAKEREYPREEMDSWSSDQREMNLAERNGNKRRGRAAPPGRCHSCNRAETPEWRRGPDGARTLCNACGLHYAKLTRKTANQKSGQSQQGAQQPGSSLRPKNMEES